MVEAVDLQFFEGRTMILTGVWFETVEFPEDAWKSNANCMGLILDGTAYRVEENPQDDYRSSLDSINLVGPKDSTIVATVPDIELTFTHVTQRDPEWGYGVDDIIQGKDSAGHLWVEFGTANSADYYPTYVANWTPKENV